MRKKGVPRYFLTDKGSDGLDRLMGLEDKGRILPPTILMARDVLVAAGSPSGVSSFDPALLDKYGSRFEDTLTGLERTGGIVSREGW